MGQPPRVKGSDGSGRRAAPAGERRYQIRPFRPADRPAVRHICAACAWLGAPAPERIGDEWIWAEFWTRFFTDRHQRLSWVVADESSGRVVGYLTGTDDVRRFDRYVPFLLPGVLARVIRKRLLRRPTSRRALLRLLRSFVRGELALPAGVARRYPATFHVNLLPEARRRGLGRAMFERFLARLQRLGVGGLHVQLLGVNRPIRAFCRRAGFRPIARSRLTAFEHLDGEPIEIAMWVRDVRGPAAGGAAL